MYTAQNACRAVPFLKKSLPLDFTYLACTFQYKSYHRLIYMLVSTLEYIRSATHLGRFQRRQMVFERGSNGTKIRA